MRKHSWLKKTVASLLTLTMLLGVAPFTVFAAPDAETAAEQALEERVFEIGGEKLTIEDLEQATIVLVTTKEGQNVTVPGTEIRTYIRENPVIEAIGGTATISMQVNTQNWSYRYYIYINANEPIDNVQIDYMWCTNSGNQYGYTSKFSVDGHNSRSLGIYPGTWFTFPRGGTATVYWKGFRVNVGSMGGFYFHDGQITVNAPG